MGHNPLIVDYESCDFRQYWGTPSKRILHETELGIIRELFPETTGWFLDLGAGFGRLLPAYSSAAKRIVLADYSIKHLQMAENAIENTNVEFVAANAYHLPFRDSVFTGGLCIRLLHHLNEPEKFARELSRVFAPESSVVVSFMNKRSLLRLLRYGFSSFRRDHSLLWRDTYGTHPEYFRRVFQQAAFMSVRREGAGLLHQVVATAPALERLVADWPLGARLAAFLESTLGRALGHLGLALMQYVLLRMGSERSHETGRAASLADILACPGCGAAALQDATDGYKCGSCHLEFTRIGRVLDFRYPRGS